MKQELTENILSGEELVKAVDALAGGLSAREMSLMIHWERASGKWEQDDEGACLDYVTENGVTGRVMIRQCGEGRLFAHITIKLPESPREYGGGVEVRDGQELIAILARWTYLAKQGADVV